MTITDALTAFNTAKALNDQAQQNAQNAYQKKLMADKFIQTAKTQAAAMVNAADDADIQAQNDLSNANTAGQNAKSALDQASIDLKDAIDQSQQTNAQESIPPNQQGANLTAK
jgi:hypothetical protein